MRSRRRAALRTGRGEYPGYAGRRLAQGPGAQFGNQVVLDNLDIDAACAGFPVGLVQLDVLACEVTKARFGGAWPAAGDISTSRRFELEFADQKEGRSCC